MKHSLRKRYLTNLTAYSLADLHQSDARRNGAQRGTQGCDAHGHVGSTNSGCCLLLPAPARCLMLPTNPCSRLLSPIAASCPPLGVLPPATARLPCLLPPTRLLCRLLLPACLTCCQLPGNVPQLPLAATSLPSLLTAACCHLLALSANCWLLPPICPPCHLLLSICSPAAVATCLPSLLPPPCPLCCLLPALSACPLCCPLCCLLTLSAASSLQSLLPPPYNVCCLPGVRVKGQDADHYAAQGRGALEALCGPGVWGQACRV